MFVFQKFLVEGVLISSNVQNVWIRVTNFNLSTQQKYKNDCEETQRLSFHEFAQYAHVDISPNVRNNVSNAE